MTREKFLRRLSMIKISKLAIEASRPDSNSSEKDIYTNGLSKVIKSVTVEVQQQPSLVFTFELQVESIASAFICSFTTSRFFPIFCILNVNAVFCLRKIKLTFMWWHLQFNHTDPSRPFCYLYTNQLYRMATQNLFQATHLDLKQTVLLMWMVYLTNFSYLLICLF